MFVFVLFDMTDLVGGGHILQPVVVFGRLEAISIKRPPGFDIWIIYGNDFHPIL